MTYLAIGAAALALILWLSRGRPILKRSEWRIASAAFALAAFAGAAYVGVRGAWGSATVLVVVGLWLLVSARRTGAGPGAPAKDGAMSEAEARSILGVGPDAARAEILAAHKRLMSMAHPDKGGTSGLAAQLNAARDRLLRKSSPHLLVMGGFMPANQRAACGQRKTPAGAGAKRVWTQTLRD